MSTYYSEYTNHILRFFVRHPGRSHFKSESDRANYRAAEAVFSRLKPEESDVLCEVFARRDTLGDNVHEVALRRGIGQDDIYALVARVSTLIAKERKLI